MAGAAASFFLLLLLLVLAHGATSPRQCKGGLEDSEYLPADVYRVTRAGGTERAFSSPLLHEHRPGVFACACCGARLFDSGSKFDSGSGWPSFTQPAGPGAVSTLLDTSHGMVRDEIVCSACGSHLGHVFNDGPRGGHRYCVNGLSLRFFDESGGEGEGSRRPTSSREELRR
jgi:methionine-R-sulfoxide reductase